MSKYLTKGKTSSTTDILKTNTLLHAKSVLWSVTFG